MNKTKYAIASVAGTLALMGASFAMAADPVITIPTSTASNLFANVSSIVTDTGMLSVAVAAVALPLAFWVIKKVKSLFSK